VFLGFDRRLPLLFDKRSLPFILSFSIRASPRLFEYIYVIIRSVLLVHLLLICAFAVSICCWLRFPRIASTFAYRADYHTWRSVALLPLLLERRST